MYALPSQQRGTDQHVTCVVKGRVSSVPAYFFAHASDDKMRHSYMIDSSRVQSLTFIEKRVQTRSNAHFEKGRKKKVLDLLIIIM